MKYLLDLNVICQKSCDKSQVDREYFSSHRQIDLGSLVVREVIKSLLDAELLGTETALGSVFVFFSSVKSGS